MPASRKRMKGRARKASRNAALPPPKSGQALRASPTSQQHQLPQMLPQDSCSHGVPTPPAEPGTKLAAFLNTFLEELGQEDCTFAQSSLAGALQTHEYFPSVWENEGDRKHLRDIIVRSGVKTITRDNNRYPNQAKIDGAAGLAMAIFMLENYDAATKLVDDFFVLKNLDIFHGYFAQVQNLRLLQRSETTEQPVVLHGLREKAVLLESLPTCRMASAQRVLLQNAGV
ncbi:hypothetical protein ACHAXT_008660 [Thalassiosira profunda]